MIQEFGAKDDIEMTEETEDGPITETTQQLRLKKSQEIDRLNGFETVTRKKKDNANDPKQKGKGGQTSTSRNDLPRHRRTNLSDLIEQLVL